MTEGLTDRPAGQRIKSSRFNWGSNSGEYIKIVEALQVSADSILRPDTHEMKSVFQGEFAELLSDCTAAETESILKIVKELKATMHAKKDSYDF